MPLDLANIKESVGDFLQSDGVQNLKTQATEGLSRVGEGIRGLGQRAGELGQSEDLKAILPYLLSGGAGAVLGGMSTGRQRAEKGEDRSGYVSRVLRNALAAGGLAAGGHYLLNQGVDKTVGNLVPGADVSEQQDGPLETAVKNVAFSPLTALGAGASALYATHDKPHIGAGTAKADQFLSRFTKETPGSPSASHLRHTATPQEIGNLERAGADPSVRRSAGLPSDVIDPKRHGFLNKVPQSVLDRLPGVDGDVTKLKGRLSAMLRRGPMSTFGQTHLRRSGRGALGLAAAGVPALLGAMLTSESNN